MSIQVWTWILVGITFTLYIGIAIWSRAVSTKEFYVACPLWILTGVESSFLNTATNTNVTFDTRVNQIIIGLSYQL
jgi:hypothetical protein